MRSSPSVFSEGGLCLKLVHRSWWKNARGASAAPLWIQADAKRKRQKKLKWRRHRGGKREQTMQQKRAQKCCSDVLKPAASAEGLLACCWC
jgi:hypothetical protein